MPRTVKIGEHTVGIDEDLFIVSEIGITCNYEVDRTRELIDVTADAGADAVKLMFEFPDELFSDPSATYQYETADGTREENIYETFQEFQFELEQWHEIKQYTEKLGLVLFASVDSPGGVEYARKLDIPAIKMSSWDYNDHPLWEDVSRLGKPILFDTGPVTTAELAETIEIMEQVDNDQYVPVHCYHTERPEAMNLQSIPYLADMFDCPVGFSSPDQDVDRDLMAIALGASVLEKRLTLSREFPEHHHVLSLEPGEFDHYVDRMRAAKDARGDYGVFPSEEDLQRREQYFKQLVADQDIEEGTELTEDMLAAKRPPEGVSPEHINQFVGLEANKDIKYNESIKFSDLC